MSGSHEYFRKIGADYDSILLRAMPWCDEMLAELVRCLPKKAAAVLELGCGTGRLTALLAAKYPGASITAVDAAAEMLEVARERLSGAGVGAVRVEFVLSAFEEFNAADGTYDVIASNWSLHHIVDKPPFYARLRNMIRPGGFFALGDELVAEPPELQAKNYSDWLALVREAEHLTEDELAELLRHDADFDHNETLRGQINILSAAGFDPVDCVWRWRNSAVFLAKAG